MEERNGKRWLAIASRAADFIFGGLMILIGAAFIAGLLSHGWRADDPEVVMVVAIGAIPLIFGVSLIFRRRVRHTAPPPDVPPDSS